MLSGIGPADHLRELGIYVLADMPAVGANLMDHPAVPVLWSTPRVKGLWESTRNRDFARWRMTHKGPLTSKSPRRAGSRAATRGCPRPTCNGTSSRWPSASRGSPTRPGAR